jgi:hypothetical protein
MVILGYFLSKSFWYPALECGCTVRSTCWGNGLTQICMHLVCDNVALPVNLCACLTTSERGKLYSEWPHNNKSFGSRILSVVVVTRWCLPV